MSKPGTSEPTPGTVPQRTHMGSALLPTGLACGVCIASTEIVRYSALWTVGGTRTTDVDLARIAFVLVGFVIVAALARKTHNGLHRCIPLLVAISVLSIAGIVTRSLGAQGMIAPDSASDMLDVLGLEAPYFLMIAYVSHLWQFPGRDVAKAVAIGIMVSGGIEAFFSFLSPSPLTFALVALLAPAACMLLRLLDKRAPAVMDGTEGLSAEDPADAPGAATPLATRPAPAQTTAEAREASPRLLALAFAMVLVCSMLIFMVHSQWLSIQDSSSASMLIQLISGVGMLIAGNILYFSVAYLRDRVLVEFCTIVTVPMLLASLYLATIAQGTQLVLINLPLNIAYATLLFLVWMFPWTFSTGLHPAQVSLGAFAAKRFGILLGPLLMVTANAAQAGTQWLAFALLIVLVFLNIAYYLIAHSRRAEAANQDRAADQASSFDRVCTEIADEYGLTPTETEVFLLLSRGRTTRFIAQALSRSESTVKTHISHIYRKLNINTQQQLLDIVESCM